MEIAIHVALPYQWSLKNQLNANDLQLWRCRCSVLLASSESVEMISKLSYSISAPSSPCLVPVPGVGVCGLWKPSEQRRRKLKTGRGRCFTSSPPQGRQLRRRSFTVMNATEQPKGQVKEEEVVDDKILPYCSINNKAEKRTVGDLEQEFLEALQSFYFENKSIMSNEEFDHLKEELMWQGSSVVMLSTDEQKFMEASLAYAAGTPIITDAQYDELKRKLKKQGSQVAIEGPRCSLRSRNVYSDLTVDYFKMFLLNVPAALVSLTLVFFLDDLTGFEITYLLELPEPYSFIVTWFIVLPGTYFIAQAITNAILKDFLILKGPCPNCGRQNNSFFGTILTVPSGGVTNEVKCEICGTRLIYNSETRLITLAPNKEGGSKDLKSKKATSASAS